LLRQARAFGDEVILDAHEAPLQTGVAVVRGGGQLRIGGRLDRRNEQRCRKDQRDDREGGKPPTVRLKPDSTGTDHCRPPSTSFSSRSCARSYEGAISSAASVCFFASACFPLFQ